MKSFPTSASPTWSLTLEAVVERLAKRSVVEGVVFVGSTGTGTVSAVSDYDILLFLQNLPSSLRGGITYIDGRLTDLLFYESDVLATLLQDDAPFSPHDKVAPLIYWLRHGRIALDRYGRVAEVKRRVQTGTWLSNLSDGVYYHAWYKVNYNLREAERMVQSSDPAYQMAVRLRLLYSIYEVWLAYMQMRRLPWQGDRKAIERLKVDDPTFLEQMQQALLETDLTRKVELYHLLAKQALAPAGGLWDEHTTALHLEDNGGDYRDRLRASLIFWEELVAEGSV